MPEPHLLVDMQGAVLQVNDPLARLFASKRKDVQGTELGAWLNEPEELVRAIDLWRPPGS